MTDVNTLIGQEAPPAPVPGLPLGVDAINVFYGQAGQPECFTAKVKLPKKVGLLVNLDRVNIKAAPLIEEFLTAIHKAKLWHCIATIGQVFIPDDQKPIHFPPKASLHAWGAALTLNFGENNPTQVVPQGYDPSLPEKMRPGTQFFPTHPIVEIAKKMGITWGGDDPIYKEPAEFIFAREE